MKSVLIACFLMLGLVASAATPNCGFQDQSALIQVTSTQIFANVSTCFAENLSSKNKAAQCISSNLQIGIPCSECFVASASCSVVNCFNFCVGGKDSSIDCKKCFNTKCFNVYSACAAAPRTNTFTSY